MLKHRQFSFAVPVVAGLVLTCPASAQPSVDFNRDIRPILSNKCFACHGPDDGKREAGLRLDDAKIATSELESGAIAIVPGKPEASELIRRVTSADETSGCRPPSSASRCRQEEIATLRNWIEQGAHYATHWSYVKPVRTAPPAAAEAWRHWPRNEIDLFRAAGDASARTCIRRPRPIATRWLGASFSILPACRPRSRKWTRLSQNEDPQAYEKLVDDLLHRPSYGEHWARMWLDLARYADSAGYADDPPRTIWAYRDWVIKAIQREQAVRPIHDRADRGRPVAQPDATSS